jgi:hypothetical protein
VDRDQIELSAVADDLEGYESVACRICLEKRSGIWSATNILADIHRPDLMNPSWTKFEYSDIAFAQDTIAVEKFASWLTTLKGELQGLAFEIPQPQQSAGRERYSTELGKHHFFHLPYPFTLYSIHSAGRDNGQQRSAFTPLVTAGLPSFPNYETAVYRFLLDRPYQSGNGLPQDLINIRLAHPEAWIDKIEVKQNSMEVTFGGNQYSGTQLTIGGPSGVIANEAIDEQLRRRFEIQNADLSHLWLVLSRDNRWLDWRDLRGAGRISTWDVSGVQPGNLAAHIERLLLQGENEWLEYKVRVPDQEDKFLKTVAAFANGSGGIILVGVADDGKVEGVQEDLNKLNDRIVNSIRNRITPQPIFQLQICEVQHRQVVGVFVQEGQESPYGLSTKPPSIYVRRHGTTFDATPGEIRALGAKNQPTAGLSYGLREY